MCAQRRLALLLSLTFTIYDVFWNSIKNECVWHKTSKRKCVKRNEKGETKRKWDNHTSLFKHLTSWYIVQYSSLRLVCFSFSLVWFPSLYVQDWEWIHQYIGHGYKQTSLLDIRRLLSFFFFLSLSLSVSLFHSNCLFKTMTFFSFLESICMCV